MKAANGADQLSAGLTSADDGAHQLATGHAHSPTGRTTARTGSAALAAGAHQLSAGIGQATTPLIDTLDRVQRLGLNPDDVGAGRPNQRRASPRASDRIAALNVDHQLAAGIVDQVVNGPQANPDPSAQGPRRGAGRSAETVERPGHQLDDGRRPDPVARRSPAVAERVW